jgi:P2-related tail formation protein
VSNAGGGEWDKARGKREKRAVIATAIELKMLRVIHARGM